MLEIAAEAVIPAALITLAGWWLARRAMRPLAQLTEAAARIDESHLQEKIVLPHADAEFVRLAEVFNAMTARLDESFQRVRQFTLYASHELKTPLSVLHAEFERMVDDPTRSEADRVLFGRNLDEIVRLTQIVDGLTFLTKADSHLIPLDRESLALQPLVQAAAEDAAVLGTDKHIQVTLERCEDVHIMGDRHRLRQLLVILCDNAIKHNRPNGTVQMSLSQDDHTAMFSIINSGPGIPPADHNRVFERFYRGSGVKADGIDGTGLGLSVAEWIATAHGGALTFRSEPERTEFTFTVKAKQENT
jgi:signal transduction histidine kinase